MGNDMYTGGDFRLLYFLSFFPIDLAFSRYAVSMALFDFYTKFYPMARGKSPKSTR